MALVGEPGVGKSRLVWEIVHSHRTDGWLVLESGSVSYGKATSWLPVIDLLKNYCRIGPRDDARAVREKVTGKLLTLDRTMEPLLPAFLSLLDVPVDDESWQALDPPNRRRNTLDALKRLLLRESREQPLLLAFEDLHWIDSETQALLDGLVEALPTSRILLLVNYRPEYVHGWGSKSYYTQIRVEPVRIGERCGAARCAARCRSDHGRGRRRASAATPRAATVECRASPRVARGAETPADPAHRGQSVLHRGKRSHADRDRRAARRARGVSARRRYRGNTRPADSAVDARRPDRPAPGAREAAAADDGRDRKGHPAAPAACDRARGQRHRCPRSVLGGRRSMRD